MHARAVVISLFARAKPFRFYTCYCYRFPAVQLPAITLRVGRVLSLRSLSLSRETSQAWRRATVVAGNRNRCRIYRTPNHHRVVGVSQKRRARRGRIPDRTRCPFGGSGRFRRSFQTKKMNPQSRS